jgi:hypothetical protein
MTEFHQHEDETYILDENGDLINSYICICYAKSPSECVCGAWNVDITEWRNTYEQENPSSA